MSDVMLGIVMLLGTCAAAEAVPAPVASTAAVEVRDAMLMLDDGPLHLRFHVSIGGTTNEQARDSYIDRLMKQLDTDGDGKVSRIEASKSPLRNFVERDNPFTRSLPPVTRKDMIQDWNRAVGEPLKFLQESSSAGTDAEVFKVLDLNGNGKLERSEMSGASRKILERDQDGDECISFPEFLPEPPAQDPGLMVTPIPESTRPRGEVATLLLLANTPVTGSRMRTKYDRNRDGRCSARELNWTEERLAKIDKDKNGGLNDKELDNVHLSDVDLELSVEMTGPRKDQPALTVLSSTGTTGNAAKRPDYVRMAFPSVVLTLAYRHIDPIPAALKNAMDRFNRLDTDANGYIDEMEVAGDDRRILRETLFTKVDADGDKKVFSEEMEKYITLRGEPDGSKSQVNVYDTGRGFFNALDRNGDGRISMRELKSSEQSLSSMKRATGDSLSPTEPVRHLHMEFVRSHFVFAGPADGLISMSPSFEQRPLIGPVWFQRMDRNSDGDVTWNEFLGPRDVFHRLDADHDALIDPLEAATAGE